MFLSLKWNAISSRTSVTPFFIRTFNRREMSLFGSNVIKPSDYVTIMALTFVMSSRVSAFSNLTRVCRS